MTAVSRQEVQAQPPSPACKGWGHFVGPMNATTIDDHNDFFAGWAEGGHDLVQILAEFQRVKMGHHFVKDFGGAILDSSHQGEEDAVRDPTPGAMLLPGVAFACFGAVQLAAGQRTEWETVPCRLVPPACARQRKPPEHGFVCIEEDNLAALGAILEGREFKPAIGEVGGIGLKTSGGATIPDGFFLMRAGHSPGPVGRPSQSRVSWRVHDRSIGKTAPHAEADLA